MKLNSRHLNTSWLAGPCSESAFPPPQTLLLGTKAVATHSPEAAPLVLGFEAAIWLLPLAQYCVTSETHQVPTCHAGPELAAGL